jgi:hypothetical protein
MRNGCRSDSLRHDSLGSAEAYQGDSVGVPQSKDGYSDREAYAPADDPIGPDFAVGDVGNPVRKERGKMISRRSGGY